jgi:hypothetical protein
VSGFGSQPFGSSSFGIGTPALAPFPGGALLRDSATGVSTGSRRIAGKDYVIDANGRIEGMNDLQQLVLIAVTTVLNSSAMPGLGQSLASISVIGNNFERRVADVLKKSLEHLTSRNLIAIVSIRVRRLKTPGAASIRLQWRDVATQKVYPLEI